MTHKVALEKDQIDGLTEAVRKIFEGSDIVTYKKHLIPKIGNEEMVTIPEYMKAITWNSPKWHHSVRAVVNELHKHGEVVRVARGEYRKTKKWKSKS